MKRTLALSLTVVAAAAGGLAYLAWSSLSAETLRLEERLRQAQAEACASLLLGVEGLFRQMEEEFVLASGSRGQVPSDAALREAERKLALASSPFAVRGDTVQFCTAEPDGNRVGARSKRFLANQERIPYVQRLQRGSPGNNDAQQVEAPAQQAWQPPPQSDQQAGQSAQNSYNPQANRGWFGQQVPYSAQDNWGVTRSSFREIVAGRESLFIPRFLDDELEILYWRRASAEQKKQGDAFAGFGFVVQMKAFRERLAALAASHPPAQDLAAVVTDDKGRVVGTNRSGFRPGKTRAFLTLDLHPQLPHWKLSAYWVRPEALEELVRSRRWLLGLVLSGCGVALLLGLVLVGFEARREAVLARKQADFVSNVSHELKTPLTSIRLYTELLQRRLAADGGPEPRAAGHLDVILGETDRLTRLVGQVLDFSRVKRGKRVYQLAPVELGELVEAVVAEHAVRYEPEGFAIELELWPEPVECRADAEALSQLLSNLLSNARKYGGGDQKRIHVALAVQRPAGGPGTVEVRVRDWGPGVPPRWRKRIFDEFVRMDSSLAAETQGSGIGLTLARAIARAHGGDVTVGDPPEGGGPGALFVFRMPLAAGGDPEERRA